MIPQRRVPPRVTVVGVTYRQLNHWVKAGWLRPDGPGGSGHWRAWPVAELEIARTMGALTRAGLPLAMAHDLARHGVRTVADGRMILTHTWPPGILTVHAAFPALETPAETTTVISGRTEERTPTERTAP